MHLQFGTAAKIVSLSSIALLLVSLVIAPAAFATNGMNLEGYGPIATGMGGASMAYDNGTAAMMNNPATLGFMPEGNRLDVAIGLLGPDITSKYSGMPDAPSSADMFLMPAFGWAQKSGQFAYGIGVFAQGGMGTEYSADSFLAAGSNEKVRSEVSMGRAILPLSADVTDKLKIGGSLDFVWAAMDLKMALTGAQFFNMAGMDPTPGAIQQQFGTVSGSMLSTFGGVMGMLDPSDPVNWGRFDFSDESDFSGKAKGHGVGGKLGAVYQVNSDLSFGFAYHSKTHISDLEAQGSTVSFNVNADTGLISGNPATGVYSPTTIPVSGTINVKDFQWPQMLGVGTAYHATEKLLVVFDYKWINWKDVMKDFNMTFTADLSQSNPLAQAFAGTTLDATMFQNWKDQHVFMLGAAYQTTEELVLRAGVNIANNPIPDTYENPLFPATIKNHVMLGAGYAINKANSVDASFTYAPEVEVTNGQNVTTSHSQMNSQIMYSLRF
jgi:long-chain fatty acid transport protein